LTLSRTPPTLLNSAVVQPFSARREFVNAQTATSGGVISGGTVHLRLDRTIHHGIHEDYDLTNYGSEAVEFGSSCASKLTSRTYSMSRSSGSSAAARWSRAGTARRGR